MAITVGSTTPTTGLLTSMGVGSGLDVATLVDKLVAAKKAPQQNQITNQAALANTQLSGLGQVGAALARGQGVDLIDHDPAQAGEQPLRHRLAEQHRHALRRGQQDFRRMAAQLPSLRRGRIAAAHQQSRHARPG